MKVSKNVGVSKILSDSFTRSSSNSCRSAALFILSVCSEDTFHTCADTVHDFQSVEQARRRNTKIQGSVMRLGCPRTGFLTLMFQNNQTSLILDVFLVSAQWPSETVNLGGNCRDAQERLASFGEQSRENGPKTEPALPRLRNSHF